MAFKPNYNQQRAERTRAKQAKKDAKVRERQEEAARRKAGDPADPTLPEGDEEGGESEAGPEDAARTVTPGLKPGDEPSGA